MSAQMAGDLTQRLWAKSDGAVGEVAFNALREEFSGLLVSAWISATRNKT
jgi:hypothetical protein